MAEGTPPLPQGMLPQGSPMPPLRHVPSGVPLLSHQSSGVPPGLLSHQSSGIPGLSHQGSGVPLLPRQGSGLPPLDWSSSAAAAAAAAAAGGATGGAAHGIRRTKSSLSERLGFGLEPSLGLPGLEREQQQQQGGGVSTTAQASACPLAAKAAQDADAAEGGLGAGAASSSDDGSSDVAHEGSDAGASGQQAGRRRRKCVPWRLPPAEPPMLDQDASAMLRLVAWLALLFVGYGFQRGLCAAGIPYDCDEATADGAYTTLTLLAFVGGGMGWFAGVTRPARFAWLAAPRRAYLWLLYLAVLPAYSGVSTIPALRVSLAGMGAWGPVPAVLKLLAVVLVLAALAFHVWLAWRAGSNPSGSGSAAGKPAARAAVADAPSGSAGSASASDASSTGSVSPGSSPSASPFKKPRRVASEADTARISRASSEAAGLGGGSAASSVAAGDASAARAAPPAAAAAAAAAAASRRKRARHASWRSVGLYLLPRLAVLVYFICWLAALPASGSYSLHLHHYALAWGVAIFCAFNHPVSGIVLSLATAVFVQGASCYGFDPVFTPAANSTGGCITLTSPPSGQMTCSFWGAQQFDIGFCSNTSWIPWFDCNVSWPWPETAIYGRPSGAAAQNVPKAFSVDDGFAGAGISGSELAALPTLNTIEIVGSGG